LIYEKIANIFAEIMGIDDQDITPETDFSIDSGVDKISVVKLIIECEKEFNITIFDEDVHDFKCIGDIAAYVGKLLAEDVTSALSTDKEREAWFYL